VRQDKSPTYFAIAVISYVGLAFFSFFGAIKMLMMAFA